MSLSTCARPLRVALLAGGGAALALSVVQSVPRRTRLHTLVLVEEERSFTAEAVGGVLPTGGAAGRTAPTQLACGVTPVRSQSHVSRCTGTARHGTARHHVQQAA